LSVGPGTEGQLLGPAVLRARTGAIDFLATFWASTLNAISSRSTGRACSER
jgi:hypothetical protein